MSKIKDFILPSRVPEPPEHAEPLRLDVSQTHFSQGLPADLTAERSILGAVLLDEVALNEAETGLQASDFALDSHRVIFNTMRALRAAGRKIDIIILSNEMARKKEIEQIGGTAYLFSLTEGLPKRISIDEYIRIVVDKSLLRQLINVCSKATQTAADQTERGMDLISEATTKLAEIAANCKTAWNARPKRDVLVGANKFVLGTKNETQWLVHGLIQKGGNGLIVGDPGTSKSLLTLKLVFHLVAGYSFFNRAILERVRCAYVAREDAPELTQQRAMKMIEGFDIDMQERLREINLDEWLYFNTRAQTETFTLQKENDVREIISAFRERSIQFAVFDVFRRLWDGDENDNMEVARVLSVLTRISTESGVSICLVHHVNKSEGGTIFQRIRGASSIYGWREWCIGLTISNPEEEHPSDRIRKMEFETKAAEPAFPIYYKIESGADLVDLKQCDAPPPLYSKKKKSADIAVPVSSNGYGHPVESADRSLF